MNKNKISIRKALCLLALAPAALLSACTGSFEDINTDPYAAGKDDMSNDNYIVSSILTGMQGWVIPLDVNTHQFTDIVLGGALGGYTADSNPGLSTRIAIFNPTNDWTRVMLIRVIPEIYTAYNKLKVNSNDEVALALASVIRVSAVHRVTDTYGPIPYSQIGADDALTSPYDSQEQVYNQLFTELNAALEVLRAHSAESIKATSDKIYSGNLSKWVRYANSLKLRMAMRLVYVIPDQAKTWAEEAVRDGVIESAEESATLASYGSIQVFNPLEEVWNAYADTRMGATMDAYLNGYSDPRLATYFKPCEDGKYHGVRNGIAAITKEYYLGMSVPNVDKTTPVRWLMSSEVAFLRAEGAMRGWAMGGDAKTFYNKGIELSFLENGLSAAQAATYAESEAKPAAFEDASSSTTAYSIGAPSQITVKWNDGADQEEQLERIITQKWIAMFPNGQEAWSEFRRTGYPKIFSIVHDRSNGTVDVNEQIRRMTFPRSEYSNNRAALNRAIRLLGGPDQGSTKLWWDKKNN